MRLSTVTNFLWDPGQLLILHFSTLSLSYQSCTMHLNSPLTGLLWGFSSVQSLSCVWLFATPWSTARQASLSITNSRSSPRLTSIESVMPASHLILCRPLLLLPANPSQHQSLFQWVNSSHEVAKVLGFSFSIIPSKEIPGLISFRMD